MSAQAAAAARDPAAAHRQALDYAPDSDRPRYALGGVIFAAGSALPWLSGFATQSPCGPPPVVADADLSVTWRTSISAYVIDRVRDLTLQTERGRTTLAIEGLGTHQVSHRGEICSDHYLDPERWAQLLCGPLLPLALARHQRFQLHASAAVVGPCLVLICGLSGSGKSTLGRTLQRRGYTLIADDVVTLNQRAPLFAGAFPQPKWPRWGGDICRLDASQLPHRTRLIVLQPGSQQSPRLSRLSTGAATLALARHSVASRLFDPSLLRRHLDWCADLAERIEVLELRYRRHLDALEPMASLLESSVEA